jgi:hypothetical protein
MGVGYLKPRDFDRDQDFDIAYVGNRSGLHWTVSDQSGRAAESVVYPFRATGPVVESPVPAPTQLMLGPTPIRCSRSQRTQTPRIVAPYQPGTRHPVLVSDPLEPLRVLLTEDAVLFGSPKAPCVAAFDADLVSTDPARRGVSERALLFVDDLEHAWVFRSGSSDAANGRVEYRTMSCRLDPNAEVPVEVFQARGTIVD